MMFWECCVILEQKYGKRSDTTRSREVTQPSTDVARDCLISRFGVELDGSSRVWPLHTYTHTQKLNTNKKQRHTDNSHTNALKLLNLSCTRKMASSKHQTTDINNINITTYHVCPKFGHIKVLFVAPNTFRGFKILRRKILLANCPLREIFLISSSKDHHFTLYYADLCENIDWKAHHARCWSEW